MAHTPMPGKPNPEPDLPSPPHHPGEGGPPDPDDEFPEDDDPEHRRPGRAALVPQGTAC